MVKDIEISPITPRPGDQIDIKIQGECDEKTPVELDYEQTIPITDTKFNLEIDKVQVPWSKNKLFIEAKNVASLNVAAKFLLWINKKIAVVDGMAQYTLKDVPKGTYNVKLSGTALPGISNVMLKITAHSELQLDKSGKCLYTFHPSPNQESKLAVRCDKMEKCVDIKTE